MSIAAALEVEESARRRNWEFWKGSVVQSLDPEEGLEKLMW